MRSILLTAILSVGVPMLIAATGLSTWAWMGLGAAVWAGSVIIKIGGGSAVWWVSNRLLLNACSKAAVWGLWSAACELGASAAVFLTVSSLVVGDVIGFGVGAGSCEALLVLGPVVLSGQGFGWHTVVERTLTSIGHVASRGLIWLGLGSAPCWPLAVVATTSFAAVDGVAVYATERRWDWSSSRVLGRFYGFLAAITGLESAAFIIGLLLC